MDEEKEPQLARLSCGLGPEDEGAEEGYRQLWELAIRQTKQTVSLNEGLVKEVNRLADENKTYKMFLLKKKLN